ACAGGGAQLLPTGQPMKLIGFGKHEAFPPPGGGKNLPMWIRDYELLRWVGANSYRTSHYPYAEEAMDLADRLGVLVINEMPAVGLNFEDSDELTAQRLREGRRPVRGGIGREKKQPRTSMWCIGSDPTARPALCARAIS